MSVKRAVAVAAFLLAGAGHAGAQQMLVHKSPLCGCCGAWAEEMARAGFEVEIHEMADDALYAFKDEQGIAPSLASCHTAMVEGYVIEGHVPAEDIRRLLEEAPEAIGLAAPGMPIGSPGMEMGGETEPYEVLLVTEPGQAEVFARHG